MSLFFVPVKFLLVIQEASHFFQLVPWTDVSSSFVVGGTLPSKLSIFGRCVFENSRVLRVGLYFVETRKTVDLMPSGPFLIKSLHTRGQFTSHHTLLGLRKKACVSTHQPAVRVRQDKRLSRCISVACTTRSVFVLFC